MKNIRYLGFGFALSFFPGGLSAQIAPAASVDSGTETAIPNSASVPNSAQVIMLPTLEVNENADKGYLAGNFLSGTRISTPIKDLPFAISAFASQFIADIGHAVVF